MSSSCQSGQDIGAFARGCLPCLKKRNGRNLSSILSRDLSRFIQPKPVSKTFYPGQIPTGRHYLSKKNGKNGISRGSKSISTSLVGNPVSLAQSATYVRS